MRAAADGLLLFLSFYLFIFYKYTCGMVRELVGERLVSLHSLSERPQAGLTLLYANFT